jgi:hypothetical protein
MIDTVVPWVFIKTSTQASSCFAKASTMVVPNPGFVLFEWPSGLANSVIGDCKSPVRFSQISS